MHEPTRRRRFRYSPLAIGPLAVGALAAAGGCSSSSTPAQSADGGSHADAAKHGDAGHAKTDAGKEAAAKTDAASSSGGRTVVVLFTSDEHSHLLAFSPELDDFPESTTAGSGQLVGGVARRLAVIKAQRAAATAAGKDSILVSAGDNNMGTLSHVAFQTSSFDYRSLMTLGYDVTTFGNHEFDFGPGALATSIATAQANGGLPPIVASNLHFSTSSSADDALQALYSSDVTDDKAIHPYRVLTTKSGVKVGVFGYVGVDASNDAPNKVPVAFSESLAPADAGTPSGDASLETVGLPYLYKDLQPVVDQLRNTEHVDLVVALAHAGIADSSSQATIETGEDWNICQNVTGIDLIVSGHAHNKNAQPMEVTNMASKPCLVLNGSAFGQHVGHVEFTVPSKAGAPVTWDKASQALVPVNDSTVPDSTEASALASTVQAIEESGSAGTAKSYLEGLLSLATGTTVTNDAMKPGDLYFYPIGKTAFDIPDTPSLLALSSDSMLIASDAWAAAAGSGDAGAGDAGADGGANARTSVLSIESAGVIRGVIKQGKTGVIAATDAFNVVPLGASPTDGTLGYPLVRAYIYLIELQGVFEFSRSKGATNSDYDLGPGGAQVEYDATRPLVYSETDLLTGKGQVMKISIASDHTKLDTFDTVIFQRAVPDANPPVPGIGQDNALIPIVTSSYIAQFAGEAGVTLKDSKGAALGMGNTAQVLAAVLHRNDGSEVKQLEGFFQWIHSAPTLPSLYNAMSPQATKRWVCVNGC